MHPVMNMMQTRYENILYAMEGYRRSGVPLVGYDGTTYMQPGFGDDHGIYILVPRIASALQLDVDSAIRVLIGGGIIGACLLGIAGLFLVFRTARARSIAVAGFLLLSLVISTIGDVYSMPAVAVMGLIPLSLALCRRAGHRVPLLLFMAFAGIAAGIANMIRAHAGTGVLLFLLAIVFLGEGRRVFKLALTGLLLSGVLLVSLYHSHLLNRQAEYLDLNRIPHVEASKRHIIWHSVYIGLGLLDNGYGIQYRDEIAMEKARQRAPHAAYLSREYERALRDEVVRIAAHSPHFVLRTLFAKVGIVALYFLVFANAGIVAALLRPKPRAVDAALGLCLAFGALPGLVVMPNLEYLTGFVAAALLWGVLSVNHALEGEALCLS